MSRPEVEELRALLELIERREVTAAVFSWATRDAQGDVALSTRFIGNVVDGGALVAHTMAVHVGSVLEKCRYSLESTILAGRPQ